MPPARPSPRSPTASSPPRHGHGRRSPSSWSREDAVAQLPVIDNRDYRQLVDDALRRIPVHNPEWTNFNRSDPGVTLLEVFAFLTESLLYRSNQIPERNRLKFLQLLGIALAPATSARGLVTFA